MTASRTFRPSTRALVHEVADAHPLIHTVTQRRPNCIVSVRDDGVMVETERSAAKGAGAALTPAWMIEVAWAHLRATGELSQTYLVASNGLNVKRSAFVMALLARFPDVTAQTNPAVLRYHGRGA